MASSCQTSFATSQSHSLSSIFITSDPCSSKKGARIPRSTQYRTAPVAVLPGCEIDLAAVFGASEAAEA
jgi:hypothetical protein